MIVKTKYLVIIILISLFSCNNTPNKKPEQKEQKEQISDLPDTKARKPSYPKGTMDIHANSLNSFSIDLYKQLKTKNKNLFVSPLSVYYSLLVVYEGSMKNTKKQFENVLYINNPEQLSEFLKLQKQMLSFKDSSNHLNIANAAWINNGLSINDSYRDRIVKNYSSEINSIDFSKKDKAVKIINEWVNRNTKGLIKRIITRSDIDEITRLIITNAIYFNSKWDVNFDKSLTKPDVFFPIPGKEVKVDYMNKTEQIRYFENIDLQYISIPYSGNDKSFCILLPQNRYGISEIEDKINNSMLISIMENCYRQEVILSIPKFKLEASYELSKSLKSIGLEMAFSEEADFSGITTEEPLVIGNIIHKTFIEIDEEKTEAAAASSRVVYAGSGKDSDPEPKIFIANHPFIFLIIDNKTRGIIFIGKYANPS